MLIFLRKLFFNISLNLALFFLLLIGIQNSETKTKVNLLIGETVNLPLSFIIGISFISGSISGSLVEIDFRNKKLSSE